MEEPIPHHVLKYAAPPHNIHYEMRRTVTAEPKRIVQVKPLKYSEPEAVPLARRRLQLKQNYESTEAPPDQMTTAIEGREESEVVEEAETEASQNN